MIKKDGHLPLKITCSADRGVVCAGGGSAYGRRMRRPHDYAACLGTAAVSTRVGCRFRPEATARRRVSLARVARLARSTAFVDEGHSARAFPTGKDGRHPPMASSVLVGSNAWSVTSAPREEAHRGLAQQGSDRTSQMMSAFFFL